MFHCEEASLVAAWTILRLSLAILNISRRYYKLFISRRETKNKSRPLKTARSWWNESFGVLKEVLELQNAILSL